MRHDEQLPVFHSSFKQREESTSHLPSCHLNLHQKSFLRSIWSSWLSFIIIINIWLIIIFLPAKNWSIYPNYGHRPKNKFLLWIPSWIQIDWKNSRKWQVTKRRKNWRNKEMRKRIGVKALIAKNKDNGKMRRAWMTSAKKYCKEESRSSTLSLSLILDS